MRVSESNMSLEAAWLGKIAKLQKKAMEQQGEQALKLIDSSVKAARPAPSGFGSVGRYIDIRV